MGKTTIHTPVIDGASEVITYDTDKGVAKIKALTGYCKDVNLLAKLTDTGKGYIVKFKNYSSVSQDNYVCIDYAQADELYKLLGVVLGNNKV